MAVGATVPRVLVLLRARLDLRDTCRYISFLDCHHVTTVDTLDPDTSDPLTGAVLIRPLSQVPTTATFRSRDP